MNEKFRNRYRIPSNRLRGWNYAGSGHYFITIVTHGRIPFFGNVENGEMILNEMGKMAYDEFFKSFEIREELFLGEFVLMPNHLHAIVTLDEKERRDNDEMYAHDQYVETHDNPVETHGRASLQSKTATFHRKPKSISSFVAGFKSSTIHRIDDWIDANTGMQTVRIAKFNKNNPLWQSNYHDHIIRNTEEYQIISNYIIENPLKWDEDKLNHGIQW